MMDNMVSKYMEVFKDENFSGWSGVNSPGELEIQSGLWITKSGARHFPKQFNYNPSDGLHWEWGAVLEGEFEIDHHGTIYKIPEGHCYVMPPAYPLTAYSINNPFLLWIEFAGPLVETAMKTFSTGLEEMTINKFSLEQVKSVFKIANLLHEHPFGYELLVHSLLWSFLAYSFNPAISSSSEISQEIKQVVDHINSASINRLYSLQEIADIANLPVETFRKKFFAEIGESPFKYLLKCKLKKSKELLSDKSLTIKEISHEVGINDQYYFSRIFKKYEGLSPTDFRRRFYC